MNEIMMKGKGEEIGNGNKKRGRRPKNQKIEYVLNKEQTKFFVDLTDEKEQLDLIFDLLLKANKKDYGRELTFKDIALYGLSKITDKDLEKIQECSLTDMERVERARDEYNKKNNSKLTLGEFLVKRLSIN